MQELNDSHTELKRMSKLDECSFFLLFKVFVLCLLLYAYVFIC